MTQLGIILAGATPAAPVRWALCHESQVATHGRAETLAAAGGQIAEATTVLVILPGEIAATRRLTLPVRGEAALVDAAQLAFEDVLAESPDDFHFGFGALGEGNRRLVTAVPDGWMAEWMSALSDAGIDPDAVYVDHAAVHLPGYDSVFLEDDGRAIVTTPEGGLSGEPEFVGTLLTQMEDPGRLLVAATGSAPAIQEKGVTVLPDDRALFALLLKSLSERGALPSLRRETYRRRRDWSGLTKQWRVAASLFAAVLALWAVESIAYGMKRNAAADALMAEATSTFQSAYPGVPIRDLRRQALARSGDGGPSAFLPLSVDLATVLESQQAVTLTALRFTDDGVLTADILLSDDDSVALERLADNLADVGVLMQEGETMQRTEDGRLAGQLFLELAS